VTHYGITHDDIARAISAIARVAERLRSAVAGPACL
jgi:hypothetical protein